MKDRILAAIHQFFRDITLQELRLMNHSDDLGRLTYTSLLYIDLIWSNQGEYTASAIAELLGVSKPAAIMKINELMAQGYLYKKQSQQDRRVYHLYVDEDKLARYSFYRSLDLAAADEMARRYSPAELEKFCEMLQFLSSFYANQGDSSHVP